MAYRNASTGVKERRFKSDAEILAKFTKFYSLDEIMENRKKLIELRTTERKSKENFSKEESSTKTGQDIA